MHLLEKIVLLERSQGNNASISYETMPQIFSKHLRLAIERCKIASKTPLNGASNTESSTLNVQECVHDEKVFIDIASLVGLKALGTPSIRGVADKGNKVESTLKKLSNDEKKSQGVSM